MENQIADTKMLLTLKTVQRQLIRLFNHFPGHGRTISNLEIIAPDYLEAFKGHYDSEFIDLVDVAIQEHGRSFFPTIGDLKEIEIAHQPYNPHGGTGSLPLAEDIPGMQDLMNVAAKDGSMSEENKELLAKFLKGIDKEMPKGESG